VDARHRCDRVVKAGDEALVEVDAGNVGDRVHEVVERPGRSGRKEQEGGLGPERRQHSRAPQPVEMGVAPAVEAHQPSDGEPDVEGHIGNVEDRDDAAPGKKKRLELGLDVDPEPPLESNDPLRVLRGFAPALVVDDEVANGEIDGVDAEADGGLAPS